MDTPSPDESTADPEGGVTDVAPRDGDPSRRPADVPALHDTIDGRITGALHRMLVESVVDYAIYALTTDGRVATWNAGAERLKGYPAAQVIGRSVSEFYPAEARRPDGVAARAQELLRLAERDGRAEDEGWRVRSDGTRFWANVIVTPLRDEQGTLIGFAKVTRDLTQRRAAEQHARELAAEQAARAAAELAEAEMRALNHRLREQAAELEAHAEEAQTLAEELEQANEQLQQTAAENEVGRARAESLQGVTATLARAQSIADVAHVFSAELTALVGADTAWVGVVSARGDAVEALGWAGYPDDASTLWRRLPMDAKVALVDVVRSREPQFWTTRDALVRAYPEREGVIRSTAQESVAVLPLLGHADGAPHSMAQSIGGIVIGFRERQLFDADIRAYFVALAQQCAQAVARASAFEAERVARAQADAARRRAEVLQSITAMLAGARSREEVAHAALTATVDGGGAESGTLALLSDDGLWFEKVASVGLPGDALVEWNRFPSEGAYPAAEVIAARAPQFLSDRDTFVARYPAMEPTLRALNIEAAAVLPLTASAGDAAIGYISLHYPRPHAFPEDEMTFVGAVAQVTSQALERVRLYEAERAARAEAEAANEAKGQFLATMSHELRTPLNAIAGYAELLELGIHGPVTSEQLGALARIQRSQKHLLSLINEVLNHARLEAGMVQYDMQDVPVAGVLAGVESVMQPQVRAKGLRLTVSECAPGLAVHADAEKLGQVLLNLLSNAVKFTDTNGRVSITARAVPAAPRRAGEVVAAGAECVEIAVTDTGIGVPADQRQRIFEPFVQVGRSLKSPGEGTGLGLAISRDLARGMGGDLRVQSGGASGSTFIVTLRRAGG